MSEYISQLDGVPFRLREPFDFDFIHAYGRVFKVYDDQDSGNICFCTEKDGQRYFVKFAGAPTARGIGTPGEAVERLKATLPVYQALRHPNLVEFLEAREVGGGFAMVFRYTDAECMGRMYPESRAKFMALPLDTHRKVYSEVLDFLMYTASQGYAAIDFYDGSIMYDFAAGRTVICDIDFFRKMPCVNDMGRMWGSSLFQSPEEYVLGAVIDEVTNVYTAGATAFALFADYRRDRESWKLSGALYDVVCRAVSADRSIRQQSLAELIHEWNQADGV
ncbi:MAG: serine/threonine protein kinase [Clostridia bacterium]|nr:serine/threonine protein kinase [Clostridia bacterium]